MESTQDQLQLTRVAVDVANGINPRDVGAVVEGVDLDRILVDVQIPIRNWPQLGTQAE